MFIERRKKEPHKTMVSQLPLFHWFQKNGDTYMWMNDALRKSSVNCINLSINQPTFVQPHEMVIPVVMRGMPVPTKNIIEYYHTE